MKSIQVIQYLSDAFDTLSQFGEDEQDQLSAEREPRAGSVEGTPLVNHRVISVMSSGFRSSESLSQRSSEDFSLLGSCEEITTSVSSEITEREQRDRQDSGVIDTAVWLSPDAILWYHFPLFCIVTWHVCMYVCAYNPIHCRLVMNVYSYL